MSINYSAATMAIIEVLGIDPETRFHVRAVAERASVSVGTASMVLKGLERSGLLTVEEEGNMKFYQYDLSDPVARQWKVLFNTTRLRPLIRELKEETDRVILFGSAGEGTDTRESDLDLFILTQNESGVRQILRGFQRKYSRHLSPLIMNAVGYARLRRQDPSLYENISRGRTLWERG